jgi:hypothetical protein
VRILPIALILVGLSWTQSAQGQGVYNPYAKTDEQWTSVKPDGTINWPTFFKSAAYEARFQSYFAMGSCVGTNQVINNSLKNNKVDVNLLPEISVKGTATKLETGIVTITDSTGKPLIVVTHPAGVSKVNVAGKMPASELKPNTTVKFLGRVDERGIGTDTIDNLEVFTPGPTFHWLPVEAKRVQTITGIVTKLTGQRLQVRVDTGKVRRLTVTLSPDAMCTVDSSALTLVSPGDEVTAKGHAYSAGAGTGGMEALFAGEVSVSKGGAAPKKVETAEVAAAETN